MTEQPQWNFLEKAPGAKARDPMQEEFFQDQSIDGIAHALVRETIQNSLDARAGEDPVRVVLSLGQLPAEETKRWFPPQVQDHFSAKEIQLSNLPNWGQDDCAYLTIEDFGTKGLEGQINSPDPKSGGNFYHFFRAEGVSNKKEGDRGSWGVGKIVIPRSSRVRSFFAVTRRASEPGLHLMGQSILRHHEVDGKWYTPDGWFCQDPQGFQIPFTDDPFTTLLKDDFRLSRSTEPGLGIVIPWIYEDQLTFEKLAEVIAGEYFIPILAGDLVIDLRDHKNDKHERFDINSLNKLKSAVTSNEQFHEVIHLAGSLLRPGQVEPLVVNVRNTKGISIPDYDWSSYDTDLPPQEIDSVLDQGRVVHFRVPMIIQKVRGTTKQQGCFDVLLKRKGGRHYPVFVRDGLLIPNQPTRKKTPDHQALIYATKSVVAEALGQAECPAHTDWKASRDKFKGQYREGNRLIPFVRDSAVRLVEKLAVNEGKLDHSLLAELLPIPTPDAPLKPSQGKEAGDNEKDKKRSPEPKPPQITPPVGRCWTLQQMEKEVHLRGNKNGFTKSKGYKLTLQAAYDLHGRDPFKAHSVYDFSLIRAAQTGSDDKSGFCLEMNQYVQLEGGDDGSLSVTVRSSEFAMIFRPADQSRDLIIKVSSTPIEETTEGDEEAVE